MTNTQKQQKIDNTIDYLLSINSNIEYFIQVEDFIYADIQHFNKNEYNVFKYIMYKWLILHSTPSIFSNNDRNTITISRRELKLVDSITTRTQIQDLLRSITHKGVFTYKPDLNIIPSLGTNCECGYECECERMVPIIAHSPIKSEITLELNTELVKSLEYLLTLKDSSSENPKHRIVYVSIAQLFRLKSLLSKRLYEILLLEEAKGNSRIQLNVDQIRKLSGTVEKYPSYADLKRYTIIPAIEEINEITKFTLLIEEIKSSRSVVGITLQIHIKQ